MGGGKNAWEVEYLIHFAGENLAASDTETEEGQRLWESSAALEKDEAKGDANKAKGKDLLDGNQNLKKSRKEDLIHFSKEKVDTNEADREELPGGRRDLRNRLARVRARLNSYTPGSFMGKKPDKFEIPEVTTLLVVGLRGSGKSAVVNHIINAVKVEGGDTYRAPLSGSNRAHGTLFLSEYSVCKGNVSLFDTRGFHEAEAIYATKVPEEWMTKGVRDGQKEVRAHDSQDFLTTLNLRGRNVDCMKNMRRDVNFVIFVVNIASFIAMKKCCDDRGLANLKALYDDPYFSFRDDRPIVVITHSEMLDLAEKRDAQLSLQNLLQIPRLEQIYEISGRTLNPYNDFKEDVDRAIMSEINVVEMLTAALKKAERHFPLRGLCSSVFRGAHRSGPQSKSHPERIISDLDDKMFSWLKILAIYTCVVSMIYLFGIFVGTHKAFLKYIVTINLPWLGRIRL